MSLNEEEAPLASAPALVPMRQYLASLDDDVPSAVAAAPTSNLIPIDEYIARLNAPSPSAVAKSNLVPIGEYLAKSSTATDVAPKSNLIPIGEYLAKRSKANKDDNDDDDSGEEKKKKNKKKKKWYQFWKGMAPNGMAPTGLRNEAMRYALTLQSDKARTFYMSKIDDMFSDGAAPPTDEEVADVAAEAQAMDTVPAEMSSFIQAMQALKLDAAAIPGSATLDKFGITEGRDAGSVMSLAFYSPDAAAPESASAAALLTTVAGLAKDAMYGKESDVESSLIMEGEIKDAGVNLFKLATVAGPSRRLGNVMARTYKSSSGDGGKVKEFIVKTSKLGLGDLVKEKKKKEQASVLKGGQFGVKFFTRTAKGKEANKWKWYFQLFLDTMSSDQVKAATGKGNFIVYTNQSRTGQPFVVFRFVDNLLFAIYVHYVPGKTMMAYDDSTTAMAALIVDAIRSPTAQQLTETALSHLSNQRATTPADLKTTMAANQALAAAIHHLVRPAMGGGAPAVGQRLHVATAPPASIGASTVAHAAQLQHALATLGARIVNSGVPSYALAVVVDDLGEALADSLAAQPQCLASVLSQMLHANMARVHSIYDSSDRVSILWDAPDHAGLAAFDYPLV